MMHCTAVKVIFSSILTCNSLPDSEDGMGMSRMAFLLVSGMHGQKMPVENEGSCLQQVWARSRRLFATRAWTWSGGHTFDLGRVLGKKEYWWASKLGPRSQAATASVLASRMPVKDPSAIGLHSTSLSIIAAQSCVSITGYQHLQTGFDRLIDTV